MTKRIRFAAALAVTAGLLTACGGSSGESATTDATVVTTGETTPPTEPPVTEPAATDPPATDPPATDPPATDPPATDPPVTDPPAADLPDWASGAMATVESDTGPLELPVELVGFCETSRSFYTAAKGLDFLAPDQSLSARQLFAALEALAPVTIETAPSPELAAQPTAAQEQLGVIIPAFEEIGFDSTRTSDLTDPQATKNAIDTFTEIRGSLETFLVEACGADADVLAQQAQGAADAAAQAAGEVSEPEVPTEPEVPVEAVPGTAIENTAATIRLSVPTDWTDTKEFVDNSYEQLVASTDVAAFEALTAPGVRVLRGEGGFRDGGFVGRVLSLEFNLEEAGCTLTDELDYDDGVYAGQEKIFDCGDDALDVRIFGGTEADEALYAMVLLIQPTGELGIRQLIVDTFSVY